MDKVPKACNENHDEKRQSCKAARKWLNETKERKKKGKLCKPQAYPSPQRPIVAVLSCADSRVIPEKIFAAKEGDLFVVRIAGNTATPEAIASLEFAVCNLGVRLIIVMGHEGCGAVGSAVQYLKGEIQSGDLTNNLHQLLSPIVMAIGPEFSKEKPCKTKGCKEKCCKRRPDLKTCVGLNTQYSSDRLRSSGDILKNVTICEAYFSFKKGEVQRLEKCSCNNN